MKTAALLALLLAAVATARPDLSPTGFIAPHFYIRPGWQMPTIRVSNLGSTVAEDFIVVCRIDSSSRAIYQCTTRVAGPLLPGRDSAFRFPARMLSGWFCSFGIRFWTVVADDSVPRNDTAATWFEVNDWGLSDTLIECWGGGATVDGRIGYWEYHYPGPTDISDLLGRGGMIPALPGACLLYACHDFDYTYFGFDFRTVLRRADGDRIRVWMDENPDGRFWPAGDSTEGYHTAFVRGGIDSVTYWLKPGEQCPGCTSASSTRNGNLQMELRVPFGYRVGDYTVEPYGDVGGIGVQVELAGLGSIAWWPQRIPPNRMCDPVFYGVFNWTEVTGADERTRNEVQRAASPTIVRGVLFLPPLLSPPFSLLSADGRKVMELKPGANDVSCLPPGAYYVREAQAQAQVQAVRKVVIAR